MSIEFDDIAVGKRFFVGDGNPEIFGRGPTEVRGSAYVEGPEIVGDPGSFPHRVLQNWEQSWMDPRQILI